MRFVQNEKYVTNHEIRFPALVTGECKISAVTTVKKIA